MRLVLFLASALALTAEIPRPEHPRPQFVRATWQSLNGPWRFGYEEAKLDRTITVPFAVESKMSGIGDTAFHPVVWYRRSFTVPAAWRGKRTLLHFGAVDYRARVWVNGQMTGEHEGGNTPFTFDITALLKPGENTVTVRAEDPPTDRSIPRGKQYWQPQSRSIFYTRTTGIWQPVWLEAVPQNYIERVRITASADGVVRFEAKVTGAEDRDFFAHILTDAGVLEACGVVHHGRATATVRLANPRLWSPDSPNLYDVTFTLGDDRVTSYFGFRTVAVENGRVTLNGKPIYLKMVLDQGYWPASVLTPPTDDAIKFDIRMTKEMGFNGARKHQKLEDPRFLYWADKMGLLVSSEMANAFEFHEDYVSRFTREWMETVERDYSHPSIIMWVPINESWGMPNARDSRQQQHLRALYSLTRALDATRLVIDNDGWEHTDSTDLFAIHDYARTGEMLAEKYAGIGLPGAGIPRNARAVVAPGFAYNGTPVILSEFGGIAYIPPGTQVPAESWGYSGVEKTPEAVLSRIRGLWEAIAKTPGFVGICYTQLTDVEQEVNGLMTYDRKMKFDAKALRDLNALLTFK